MAKLKEEEMKQIFQNEIPIESLEIDNGIYEFHLEGDKSIGISYENIEGKLVYIFNLFLCNEYINIDGEFESIYDAVETVAEKWNKWQ